MRHSKVRLSPTAERWFLNAVAGISAVNPAAARHMVIRLNKLLDRLSSFPEMGERGQLPGTRRVVMPPFILTTRLRDGVVESAAIRHARQRDARAPSDLGGEVDVLMAEDDDGSDEPRRR